VLCCVVLEDEENECRNNLNANAPLLMIHRVLVIQSIKGVALSFAELGLSLLLARAPLETHSNLSTKIFDALSTFPRPMLSDSILY
jgi:hypothetical protein